MTDATSAAPAMPASPTDPDFQRRVFPYRRAAELDAGGGAGARHPVVVVGAGPVGLSLAIDLAMQGLPVLLLDDDDRLSTGSRAICFAKRTLEIFDRLGCGDRIVAKGVSWHVGKVFLREHPLYRFDLLPEAGHRRPAFVNLQQYCVEGMLAERVAELPAIDLRWKSQVVGCEQHDDHVTLQVQTPDGDYALRAAFVVACDGPRSTLRRLLGLQSQGRSFQDRFLIADVKMAVDFPAERWFWFDPPFHPGQSVLLHKQPDGVWRIDFQLGWDADPEREKQPERIVPRVRALLAASADPAMREAEFSLEWASVYSFSCQRLESFRHRRVLFAGDSAHGVSPFGARGANSGVQDADNLAWKLAAVLAGRAGDALLDSYAREREFAADENIRHSTRATDFITPKSGASRVFRDAVLQLARSHPFARALVNSGRLSVPATLDGSALNSAPDAAEPPVSGAMRPGAAAADAPVAHDGRPGWLLRCLSGDGGGGQFSALLFDGPHTGVQLAALQSAAEGLADLQLLRIGGSGELPGATTLQDPLGLVRQRYDGRPGSVLLLRPDQHLCARWTNPDPQALAGQARDALRRALCL